jgi:hypothetical protein
VGVGNETSHSFINENLLTQALTGLALLLSSEHGSKKQTATERMLRCRVTSKRQDLPKALVQRVSVVARTLNFNELLSLQQIEPLNPSKTRASVPESRNQPPSWIKYHTFSTTSADR